MAFPHTWIKELFWSRSRLSMCIYESHYNLLSTVNSVKFTLLNQVSRLLIVVVHFWLSSCFCWPCRAKLFYKLWSKMKCSFLMLWLPWHFPAMLIERWLAFLFYCFFFFFVVNLLYFDFVIAVLFEGKSSKLSLSVFLWIEGPSLSLLLPSSGCSLHSARLFCCLLENWDLSHKPESLS